MTDVADRVDGLGGLLGRLDRILGRATERMVQALGPQASGDPFRGLYISDHDAMRLSTSPRSSPILGVAEGEVSLAEVLEPGSRLATLARDHGLSGFDLEVVGLALAPEIELVYERLYAFLQDDVSRRRPSVDLALNLLCPSAEAKVARREHFASDAPLIRHELVALQAEPASPSPPLLARFIKLDDAVVRFLLGEGGLDPRVRHDCALLEPGAVRAAGPTVDARVGGLAPMVATAHATCRPLRLYFSGPPDGAKRQAAALLAAAAGARLLVVDVDGALEATDAPAVTARLLCREARLHDAILYLEPAGALASAEAGGRRLMEALADHAGVAIIAGAANEPPRGRGVAGIVSVPFPIPEHDERRACWERSTSAQGIALAPDDIDRLAGRFRLTPDQISDAVQSGAYVAYGRGEQPSAGDLFAAARSRSDTDLAGVARKIEPTHDWGDIVLPEDTLRQLREICQQVVKRHQVLDRWGFDRKLSLGKGVNALFAGPSGTGKTMAAEIIAGELGLDLYKIDLSGVVSKYIGETEKNLDAHLQRGRERQRDPVLRRGRRAVRQALRGARLPRPLRQHRDRLPAAADGGVRGRRHPGHQPAPEHGRGVRPAAALRRRVPLPRRRAARPHLGAAVPRRGRPRPGHRFRPSGPAVPGHRRQHQEHRALRRLPRGHRARPDRHRPPHPCHAPRVRQAGQGPHRRRAGALRGAGGAVTVELCDPLVESPVQAALAELLDREWQAQSARMAPLAMTSTVRESIELVLAESPYGIFAVASELSHPAASPGELLDRLHDRLPAAVSPWTARTLRRVGSLRPVQPLLMAPAAPATLEPAPPNEATRPEPTALPERDARSETRAPAPTAPEPPALGRRRRRLAPALALAAGAVAGAGLGALGQALALAHTPSGALAGALAAALGGGVGWIVRGSVER